LSSESLRRARGGLFDIIDRMREGLQKVFDLGGTVSLVGSLIVLFRKFSEVESSWGTSAGVKERAEILVQAGELVAAQTETTDDDALVAQLRKLLDNQQLLDAVAWVIGRFTTEVPGGDAAALAAFMDRKDITDALSAQAADAQGLSISDIVTTVKAIYDLVQLLRGLFGGSTTGANGGSASGNPFDF
jgi:hypothetical protein